MMSAFMIIEGCWLLSNFWPVSHTSQGFYILLIDFFCVHDTIWLLVRNILRRTVTRFNNQYIIGKEEKMKALDLKITSFKSNGEIKYVDTIAPWGKKVHFLLKENIGRDEEIDFCVLTTTAEEELEIKALHHTFTYSDGFTHRDDWCYCLALLSDRVIVIDVHYNKGFIDKCGANCTAFTLSSIETISLNQWNTDKGVQINYDLKIKGSDKLHRVGYKVQYHPYLKGYFENIKSAIDRLEHHKHTIDFIAEMERLAKLKEQGFLNEEEFNLAKKRLLE